VCRPSLPGLAKVCRLLRVFLKYEPAAATDIADKAPPSRAAFFSVPLIRMVYEANPAISSVSRYGLPYINVFVETLSIPFATCTPCIQRLPLLKDPGNGKQFCTCSEERQSRKYSPGSQLLSRKNISVKLQMNRLAPTFICVKVLQQKGTVCRGGYGDCAFPSIILLELQRL
jgi:hypothetical protein